MVVRDMKSAFRAVAIENIKKIYIINSVLCILHMPVGS